MKIYTKTGIRNLLGKCCKEERSIAGWAKKYGFSRSYISEALKGKKDPTKSKRLMETLGLHKPELYHKVGARPTMREAKEAIEEDMRRRELLGEMYHWPLNDE